jgi:hypothetical protein
MSPEDDLERYSNASQEEFRHHEREQDFLQDFESAPELAELEFIHRLIRETGSFQITALIFEKYYQILNRKRRLTETSDFVCSLC